MSLIVSGWPPPGGKKKLLLTLFWCINSFSAPHNCWWFTLLYLLQNLPLTDGNGTTEGENGKKPTTVCFKLTAFSLALRSEPGAKACDLRRVPSDAPKLRTTDHWALKSYKNSWMQLPCKSDFGVQLNESGPAGIASPLSSPLHPRSLTPMWRR